jgi:hypothetical protein
MAAKYGLCLQRRPYVRMSYPYFDAVSKTHKSDQVSCLGKLVFLGSAFTFDTDSDMRADVKLKDPVNDVSN